MKITNTSPGAIVLPAGETVPANGSAEVDDAAWGKAKGHPVVAGMLKAGSLIEDGGEAKPSKPNKTEGKDGTKDKDAK